MKLSKLIVAACAVRTLWQVHVKLDLDLINKIMFAIASKLAPTIASFLQALCPELHQLFNTWRETENAMPVYSYT